MVLTEDDDIPGSKFLVIRPRLIFKFSGTLVFMKLMKSVESLKL